MPHAPVGMLLMQHVLTCMRHGEIRASLGIVYPPCVPPVCLLLAYCHGEGSVSRWRPAPGRRRRTALSLGREMELLMLTSPLETS